MQIFRRWLLVALLSVPAWVAASGQENSNRKANVKNNLRKKDFCGETSHQISALTSKQQELLRKYGVVEGNGKDKIIISEKLVPDCFTRVHFGRLISRILGTGSAGEEETFAKNHSTLLGRVVRALWPVIAESPAVPNDGALPDEKWALLNEPALSDSDVTAIVSAEIESGLDGNVAYLLFHRTLPQLNVQIISILDVNSKSVKGRLRSTSEKLYAIAILSRKPKPNLLLALWQLEQLESPSPVEQTTIEKMSRKLRSNRAVEWKDMDELAAEEL